MAVIFFAICGKNFVMNFYLPTPNGVCFIKDGKCVLSCINESGKKKLQSKKIKYYFLNMPFLRGLQYFFIGIYLMFFSIIENKKMYFVKKSKILHILQKVIFFVSGISFLIVYAYFCVGFLPSYLGFLFFGARANGLLRNLLIAILKILAINLFFFLLRFFFQFCEILKFNYAIEKSLKKSKKESVSPNFLNFLLFVFFLDVFVITLCGADYGFFLNLFFHIFVLIVTISISYEILLLVSKFSRFNILPIFVFIKSSKTHDEIVQICQTEMNFLQKGRGFMTDEKEIAFAVLYNEVRNKLSLAGINDKSDAEWIIATVLNKSRSEIKLVTSVSEKQYKEIMKATERRADGESVDNIFGFTEFFGLRFDVNKKVLTPRMETEILVELVLAVQKEYKNCSILDIGTGSGAIAISLAKNSDAEVTAVDISKDALAVATSNAKKIGVNIEFLHSNLFDGLKRKRKFDIIVSNPPYIPTAEIEKLDKHVRTCDPILALDGGQDGLDFYREIISQSKDRLNPDGQVFFEIGKGQASAVRKLLRENGYKNIKTTKDYNNVERIVSGKL